MLYCSNNISFGIDKRNLDIFSRLLNKFNSRDVVPFFVKKKNQVIVHQKSLQEQ